MYQSEGNNTESVLHKEVESAPDSRLNKEISSSENGSVYLEMNFERSRKKLKKTSDSLTYPRNLKKVVESLKRRTVSIEKKLESQSRDTFSKKLVTLITHNLEKENTLKQVIDQLKKRRIRPKVERGYKHFRKLVEAKDRLTNTLQELSQKFTELRSLFDKADRIIKTAAWVTEECLKLAPGFLEVGKTDKMEYIFTQTEERYESQLRRSSDRATTKIEVVRSYLVETKRLVETAETIRETLEIEDKEVLMKAKRFYEKGVLLGNELSRLEKKNKSAVGVGAVLLAEAKNELLFVEEKIKRKRTEEPLFECEVVSRIERRLEEAEQVLLESNNERCLIKEDLKDERRKEIGFSELNIKKNMSENIDRLTSQLDNFSKKATEKLAFFEKEIPKISIVGMTQELLEHDKELCELDSELDRLQNTLCGRFDHS